MSASKERWNELCFLLSEDIKKDISEQLFEQQVIQALLILGWKKSAGDFEVRPSIQLGAANKITPDLVVKSAEKRNLFVIEIKQPILPHALIHQKQLFSYMRLLKVEYGILIGQSIQVFYDGPKSKQSDPLLLDTIKFEIDSEKGCQFVELFSKDSFSILALEAYVTSVIENINRKQEIIELVNMVVSEEYKSKILGFIKQDLISDFDGETIDSVLHEIKVSVDKNAVSIPNVPVQIRRHVSRVSNANADRSKRSSTGRMLDRTRYVFNGETYGKNRLVLAVITEYVRQNPQISYSELKAVFPDSLQKQETFATELNARQKKDKRNFYESNELIRLSDEVIAVSNQWGKFNIIPFIDHCRKIGFHIDEVK